MKLFMVIIVSVLDSKSSYGLKDCIGKIYSIGKNIYKSL